MRLAEGLIPGQEGTLRVQATKLRPRFDITCYGGGTPTPRIDRLAAEGIRFNNYTVEAQCTPTRSAILTGRQPVRSGTFTVPLPGQGESGLAPWECTIAELLSDAGVCDLAVGQVASGGDRGQVADRSGL
jgi:arylsulfatase A-like enzyme